MKENNRPHATRHWTRRVNAQRSNFI